MAKRVPVFAYTADEKTARGHLDFFNNELFQKFLAEGGSIIIRYEGGDVGLSVQPTNILSSESADED